MSFLRQLTQWSRKEITELFKKLPARCRSAWLDVATVPQSGPIGRLLIIIPRKVGTAPQRNLIRRRIKAIFYEHKLFELGYDWVFFVKPPATQLPFAQLVEHIMDIGNNLSKN